LEGINMEAFLRNNPLVNGEVYAVKHVLTHIKKQVIFGFQRLQSRFVRWTKPISNSLLLGTGADLFRSKPQLVAENAL
jgi:hypothetical protein